MAAGKSPGTKTPRDGANIMSASNKQVARIKRLRDRIDEIEAEFEAIDDKDKADLEQEQALSRAKRDLKRSGAHVGRAGSTKHADRVEERLDGIEATLGL